MSQLSEIVDSLESKMKALLQKHENLKQQNLKLEDELQKLKTQQQSSQKELNAWQEKFESLKMANAMLGSDHYKRDTKLKINALVREIDQCIAQLSE
ncbi:MAG: hypothetical protein CL596_00880 [Alteromonas sp.]|nr:hypothetical protein [Alteromonas sp.]MAY21431.1 hypothetical protein [Flavobacteriaceae bacterium]|tara:strand:+ start:16873 stop:17163 length:291 start_codon:yes stop_codon:yes gene_type:complete